MNMFRQKQNLCVIIIICLTLFGLVGCDDSKHTGTDSGLSQSNTNEEDEINGRITEETGSIEDYIGWWKLEKNGDIPFSCIEIPKDNIDEVRCYDEKGNFVDRGDTDYSEQRMLNGNALIVFIFDNIGELTVYPSDSEDGAKWMYVRYNDQMNTFKYQEILPFDENSEYIPYYTIDEIINQAIILINLSKQDNLSKDKFEYERVLAYDSLSSEDKMLYDEMIAKVRVYEPFSYKADEVGYDVLDRVLSVAGTIRLDNPELENYFFIYEVFEGDMTTALESRYFMPWDLKQNPADITELQKEIKKFDMICDRVVERMPKELSVYDQYRYLATVISLVTDYDHETIGGWQVATAYGSIAGGYSICQGYSRGFQYLCRKANLWCVCIEGVVEGDSHMWNMVKLNSGTYYIDVTWSDGLGYPDSVEWLQYFMLTEEQISIDHSITGEEIENYLSNALNQ